jgi:Sideroflexins
MAIGSSILGSVGLRKGIERFASKNLLSKVLMFSTPYIGCAFASCVNLYFSRKKDIDNGIEIDDLNG